LSTQPAWRVEFPNDWGVPDWRDEGQYPAPGDLTAELWRWQFIRRMQDYREAWDRAAPIERACLIKQREDASKVLEANSVYFRVSGVAFDGPDDFWGLIRYPMATYPNPRANTPQIAPGFAVPLIFQDMQAGSRSTFGGREGVLIPKSYVRPGHAKVTFDLTAPLGPQLERAAKHLKRAQEHYGKTHNFLSLVKSQESLREWPKKWPLYLRVLDARNDGATYDEIGRTVRPNDARDELKVDAKRWHDAAKRVANKGTRYR
jgi:hypothetical protein